MTSDVLVIGSGFGGCAPALRLAEAGARVTLLERGPRIGTADFVQTQDPTFYTRYYRKIDSEHLSFNYIEALGGGSGFYEMASFRAPSAAFAQTDPDGRPLWPAGVDRTSLGPHYDEAERMLSVHQLASDRVPKNGLIFARMMRNLGYTADRGRYASRGCIDSGFCLSGCIYGAKQSLLVTYLPRAEAAGMSTICDTTATEIRPVAGGYEVRCTGPDGHLRYMAPIVVIAGGTIGSASLLLHSPKLTLSEHLGRNLTHNGCTKVAALLGDDLPDGDLFRGRSHAGMVSYQFLGSHGIMLSAEKPLPLQIVSAARIRPRGSDPDRAFWGDAHAELMASLRTRGFVLAALGFSPADGRLVRAGKGVKLHLEVTDALRTYLARTHEVLEHVLTANGCEVLETDWVDQQGAPYPGLHLSGAHQMGSARMGESRDQGVVDAFGEVFDHPGLFVTDGSAMCSALAVNPSLTILANAERIAAELVRRHA